MAIGSNLNLLTSPEYLVIFAFSALGAAEPALIAASLTELSANVFTHVASQQRDLPRLKGKRVMPSGLLPSPQLSPFGSGIDDIEADFNARKIVIYSSMMRISTFIEMV